MALLTRHALASALCWLCTTLMALRAAVSSRAAYMWFPRQCHAGLNTLQLPQLHNLDEGSNSPAVPHKVIWKPVRDLHGAGAKALLSRVDAWVLSLAPHTVDIASKAVRFMNLPQVLPVRLLVPVFPVEDLVTSCQPPADCNRTASQQKIFVLQGLFQSQR